MTQDIFDNKILCNECGKIMKPFLLTKNGFNLRTLKCEKCNETLVHPSDKKEYEEFMRLKNKEFEVKMRMVGNSYAVSIPREIVDFMQEQEKMMDNMVKLCFQDANRISLMFGGEEDSSNQVDSRVVKSREVRVVRNNKPVIHVRQVSDSANPKNNQFKIIKNKSNIEDDEIEEDL